MPTGWSETTDGAAALETTLSGPRLRFDGPTVVALTGAPTDATVGDRTGADAAAFALQAGDVLKVGTARAGLRTYVAFRAGSTYRSCWEAPPPTC